MSIEAGWPKIRRETRQWLMENNGDALSADILRAGGEINGSYLADEVVDWVEAVANGENPDPPIARGTR